jgi:DNA-binding NarL/FixJ family response regulator
MWNANADTELALPVLTQGWHDCLVEAVGPAFRLCLSAQRAEDGYHCSKRTLLSTPEAVAAQLCARGHSSLEIAASVNASDATVRTRLSRVRAKLRLRETCQIPAAWRAIEVGPVLTNVCTTKVCLTFEARLSERAQCAMSPAAIDIAGGLRSGKTNARIADDRGASERTVVNQLARLFQKFRAGSRVELMARLL